MLQGSIFVIGFAGLIGLILIAACIVLYLKLHNTRVHRDRLSDHNKNMATSMRVKSEFLIEKGHEIQTTTSTLTSFINILAKRVAQYCSSDSKEEMEGILAIVSKSGEDMVNIVNDVLDYIRIDANLLEIKSVPMSIKQIIHDICHTEKPNIIDKNLTLSIKYQGVIPQSILGDPVRIRQILSNLITNAIKFTEKGSITVLCEAFSDKKESDAEKETEEKQKNNPQDSSVRLKISITDTGIGLSPAQQRELFKPSMMTGSYYQQQKKRGTGFGLSTAMRLATLMDGTIEVESTLGHGSTFSLCLNAYLPQTDEPSSLKNSDPLTQKGSRLHEGLEIRRPSMPESDTSDKSKILQGMKILVVEDMTVNQAILTKLLRGEGAIVEIADNGAAGVQKVMSDMDNGLFFDVILMDMQMPVMDGYEATAYLRKHGYDRPIIAVTAHAQKGEWDRILKSGCNDCTIKPIDNKDLFSVIKKHV